MPSGRGVSLDQASGGVGIWEMLVKDLVGWVCARLVVRQHGGWTYFENAVAGRRRCHWHGGACGPCGPLDHTFMRSGNIVRGPSRHEVPK